MYEETRYQPLPNLSDIIGPGPFACNRCRCVLAHWGMCERCIAQADREELELSMLTARGSIPRRFRWARFEAEDDTDEQKSERQIKDHVHPESIRRVLALRKPYPTGVALVGATGAGKTTLACALLRKTHDWVNPSRAVAEVDRARSSYFVAVNHYEDSHALAFPKFGKGEKDAIEFCNRMQRASLLVLDNVEPVVLKSPVGHLLLDRHNLGLTTIITTWMSQEEAAKSLGGGLARRAYEMTVNLVVKS